MVAADAGDELAGRVPSPGELIHEGRLSGAVWHTCSIASKRRIWRGEGGLLLPQCGDGNKVFSYYSFLVITSHLGLRRTKKMNSRFLIHEGPIWEGTTFTPWIPRTPHSPPMTPPAYAGPTV